MVGLAGDLTHGDKDLLRTLLILSRLRGEDSTGIAAIDNKTSEASVIKVVGTPDNLFDTLRFDRMTMYDKSIIIGHTRKTTVGGTSRYTAHPFEFGDLVGVHNGTLDNWRALPGSTLATDSMMLYRNMAENGVRETIEEVKGAYALVWYNSADNTLNFLRNSQRTLYYGFLNNYKKIIWASEPWMIHVAVNRSSTNSLDDMAPKDEPLRETQILDEDKWFKVRIGNGAKPLTFLGEEELKGGVKAFSPAPFHQQGIGRSPWDWETLVEDANEPPPKVKVPLLPAPNQVTTPSAVASTTTNKSSASSKQTSGSSSSQATRQSKPTLTLVHDSKKSGSGQSTDGGKVDSTLKKQIKQLFGDDGFDDSMPTFDNEIKGFGAAILTKAMFENQTKQECSFCSADVSFEDAKGGAIHRWISPVEFVCKGCTHVLKGEMNG